MESIIGRFRETLESRRDKLSVEVRLTTPEPQTIIANNFVPVKRGILPSSRCSDAYQLLFDVNRDSGGLSGSVDGYAGVEEPVSRFVIIPHTKKGILLDEIQVESLPEDSKICMICWEPYDIPAVRGPDRHAPYRLRGCGHVLDINCLHQWTDGQASGSKTCPVRCEIQEGPCWDGEFPEGYRRYLEDYGYINPEIDTVEFQTLNLLAPPLIATSSNVFAPIHNLRIIVELSAYKAMPNPSAPWSPWIRAPFFDHPITAPRDDRWGHFLTFFRHLRSLTVVIPVEDYIDAVNPDEKVHQVPWELWARGVRQYCEEIVKVYPDFRIPESITVETRGRACDDHPSILCIMNGAYAPSWIRELHNSNEKPKLVVSRSD